MADAITNKLLRTILDEAFNTDIGENINRAGVAASLLAVARQHANADAIREAERAALKSAPTMWR